MKNFWLDRKTPKETRGISFQTRSGHTIEMIDDFVDLSQVSSAGGRYKEYERLSKQISTDGAFAYQRKKERRWKRMEIMSSMGTSLIFKDDNSNCGQWTNKEEDGRK